LLVLSAGAAQVDRDAAYRDMLKSIKRALRNEERLLEEARAQAERDRASAGLQFQEVTSPTEIDAIERRADAGG
jgi:hypothetical protein